MHQEQKIRVRTMRIISEVARNWIWQLKAQVWEPELEMAGTGRRLRSFISLARCGFWKAETGIHSHCYCRRKILTKHLLPAPVYPP